MTVQELIVIRGRPFSIYSLAVAPVYQHKLGTVQYVVVGILIVVGVIAAAVLIPFVLSLLVVLISLPALAVGWCVLKIERVKKWLRSRRG